MQEHSSAQLQTACVGCEGALAPTLQAAGTGWCGRGCPLRTTLPLRLLTPAFKLLSHAALTTPHPGSAPLAPTSLQVAEPAGWLEHHLLVQLGHHRVHRHLWLWHGRLRLHQGAPYSSALCVRDGAALMCERRCCVDV